MKRNSGFSLLELSIVLVIIGLIAGGIVAGSSMIRAAELRAVITEQNQYKIAVMTFRDKYLGIPGDLKNAKAFWGEAHATDGTCRTTASTGTETCNGDGDRRIDVSTASHESFRFWQHLANAELINGTFNGISENAVDWDAELGVNSPESKLSGGGWSIVSDDFGTTTDTQWFDLKARLRSENAFIFGAANNDMSDQPLLTTEEAWNIDKKLDDGLPGKGNVQTNTTVSFALVDCATGDDPDTAEYKLSFEGAACATVFYGGF